MSDNPNHDTLNDPYEDIVAAVAMIRAASDMLCEHPAATILNSISNELNQERLALLENERGRAYSVSGLLEMKEADRHKTAWQTYLARSPKEAYTQLYVRMRDGTCLLCDELYKFNKFEFGPAVLGEDGSILMYPTHRKANFDDEWDLVPPPTEDDADWGINLIYIPATEIAEIKVKHPFDPEQLAEK